MNKPLTGVTRRKLRSSEWFNNPHNPGMTALYLGASSFLFAKRDV